MFFENYIFLIYFNLGGNSDQSGDAQTEYIDVRFRPRNKQSHHVGGDIELECRVQGPVVKPIEYKYTKDGQPLANRKI
jgi:hypothetical protein